MPQGYYIGVNDSSTGRAIAASSTDYPVCEFEVVNAANARFAVRSFWVSFRRHASGSFDWFTHDDAPIKVRLVRVDDSNGASGATQNKLDDSISDTPAFLVGGQTGGTSWTGTVTDVYASWYVHPLWTPCFERTFPPNAPLIISGKDTPDAVIGIDITTGSKALNVFAGGHVEAF